MTSTFTQGATTITPLAVTGYEHTRASRNRVHPIVGTPSPFVTFNVAALRKGTLECVVATLTEALDLDALAAAGEIILFESTTFPALDMYFVLNEDGEIKVTLEEDTHKGWLVSIDFHEVTV